MTQKSPIAHTFTRTDTEFASGTSFCATWVYRPEGVKKPPVVILGHGLGGTRDMRLDAFAERFAQHGFAAVVFTYRNFGTSGGEPRQLLSIKQQHEDWEAAIAWAKTQDAFDRDRICIWGTSFGGGHAITTAAKHPELSGAIAQCPFTDGLASSMTIKPHELLKTFPIVARDLVAAARGTTPHMVALAGVPGTAALMTAPDALPGMEALVGPESGFVNKTAARVLPTIIKYRPGRQARNVRVPILFCVSNHDSVAPTGPTLRYAATAPFGQTKVYDIGHFDFYVGKPFEAAIADQITFLDHIFERRLP